MLTVPLPEDSGRQGDGRPKVHRYRSHLLDLGRRLRAFRARYGLTQDEIARAIGAGDHATVSQWESGVNVPEGGRRQRLELLLAGRLWPELRGALIVGDGMPATWDAAARWYRRASRERPPRETAGETVATALEHLRTVPSLEALRERYRQDSGEWIHRLAITQVIDDGQRRNLRRVEDAAYGLRWLELAHHLLLDPRRSLAHQLPHNTVESLGAAR